MLPEPDEEPRVVVISPNAATQAGAPPYLLWEVHVENVPSDEVNSVRIDGRPAAFDGELWWGIGDYAPGQHSAIIEANLTEGDVLTEQVSFRVLAPNEADAFQASIVGLNVAAGDRIEVACERVYGTTRVPAFDARVEWIVRGSGWIKGDGSSVEQSGIGVAFEAMAPVTAVGTLEARCIDELGESQAALVPVHAGPVRSTFVALTLPPGLFVATAGDEIGVVCKGIDAWGNETFDGLSPQVWPAGAADISAPSTLRFERAGDVVVSCGGSAAATEYSETIIVLPDFDGHWTAEMDFVLPAGPAVAGLVARAPQGRLIDAWGNRLDGAAEYRLDRAVGSDWYAVDIDSGNDGVRALGTPDESGPMRFEVPGRYRWVLVRAWAWLPGGPQWRVPGQGLGVPSDGQPFDVVPRPTVPFDAPSPYAGFGQGRWSCDAPGDGRVLIRPSIDQPSDLVAMVRAEDVAPTLRIDGVLLDGQPLNRRSAAAPADRGTWYADPPEFTAPPTPDLPASVGSAVVISAAIERTTGLHTLVVEYSWEVVRDYPRADSPDCVGSTADEVDNPMVCPPAGFAAVAPQDNEFAGRRDGQFSCTWVDAYAAGLVVPADRPDGLQEIGNLRLIEDVATVEIVQEGSSDGFSDLRDLLVAYLQSEVLTPLVLDVLKETPNVASATLGRAELTRVYPTQVYRSPFALPEPGIAIEGQLSAVSLGIDAIATPAREIVGDLDTVSFRAVFVPQSVDGSLVFVEPVVRVDISDDASYRFPTSANEVAWVLGGPLGGLSFEQWAINQFETGIRTGLASALRDLIPTPLAQVLATLTVRGTEQCVATPGLPELLWTPGVERNTNEACGVAPTRLGPAAIPSVERLSLTISGGDYVLDHSCSELRRSVAVVRDDGTCEAGFALQYLIRYSPHPIQTGAYEDEDGRRWGGPWYGFADDLDGAIYSRPHLCHATTSERARQDAEVNRCWDWQSSLETTPGRLVASVSASVSSSRVAGELDVLDGGLRDGRRMPGAESPQDFLAAVDWSAANAVVNAFYRSGFAHMPASATAAGYRARIDLTGAQFLCVVSRMGLARVCYDQCDYDGDTLFGSADSCPFDEGSSCEDNDSDGDGVPLAEDNCPTVANLVDHDDDPSTPRTQPDGDGDGIGNACDCDGTLSGAFGDPPELAAQLLAAHGAVSVELLGPPQLLAWGDDSAAQLGVLPLRIVVDLKASGSDVLREQLDDMVAHRVGRYIDLSVSGLIEVGASYRGLSPTEVADREAADPDVAVTTSAEFGTRGYSLRGLHWSSQDWESAEALGLLMGIVGNESDAAEGPDSWATEGLVRPLVASTFTTPDLFDIPLFSLPTLWELAGAEEELASRSPVMERDEESLRYTVCVPRFRFGFAGAELLSTSRVGSIDIGLQTLDESFRYRAGERCETDLTEDDIRSRYGDLFFSLMRERMLTEASP